MPRGKRAHIDPPTVWKVSLPRSLAVQVELFLYDPAREKIAYAARSALIEGLLSEWLRKQINTPDGASPEASV
jgi:hypothetical protein